MRILALDVGTKRIGVALSDELLITAQGFDTIYRTELNRDLSVIKNMAIKNGVTEIVAGLPLNMDGTHSAKTREVIEFVDQLLKVVQIPVNTWDERLTSLQADRFLLEADMSRMKRKKLNDKLAAQILLQGYLDSRKKGR